ncbi:MAG: hypothetical protein Q9208_004749 [Pyrenodesmia sp. 3 TL-2023]
MKVPSTLILGIFTIVFIGGFSQTQATTQDLGEKFNRTCFTARAHVDSTYAEKADSSSSSSLIQVVDDPGPFHQRDTKRRNKIADLFKAQDILIDLPVRLHRFHAETAEHLEHESEQNFDRAVLLARQGKQLLIHLREVKEVLLLALNQLGIGVEELPVDIQEFVYNEDEFLESTVRLLILESLAED